MVFSNRVISITQDTIVPKVVDNILTDSFMFYRYVGNGKKWSGETLKFPIKISKTTQGKSFSGLDYLNTGTSDTRVTLSYDPRGYSVPVAIPGLEESVNNIDESQVVSLVKAEMESSQMDMIDSASTIFYGDGTGSGGKDFNGLGNINDDGTTAATIGNLSRTTYTSLKGTRTSASGTLTLTKLATLRAAVSGGSANSQRPTLIVGSESEFNLFESLLSPTVRANYETNGYPMTTRTSRAPIPAAQLKGSAGFSSLVYSGIPWVSDEKAPTGTIWMLNENYITWYGLKGAGLTPINLGQEVHEGVYNDQPTQNTGMQWRPFQMPDDQYAKVAQLFILGNLVTNQPRRQGRLTEATAI